MTRAVRYEKSCGIIIINNGSILLLHYPSGHWDFPKGHVDGDETEEQTASRELFEETSIKDFQFISGFRHSTNYHYRRSKHIYQKKVVYFLATTDQSRVVISEEHQGYGWFGWDQAEDQITFDNSRTILEAAKTFIHVSSNAQGTSHD